MPTFRLLLKSAHDSGLLKLLCKKFYLGNNEVSIGKNKIREKIRSVLWVYRDNRLVRCKLSQYHLNNAKDLQHYEHSRQN